MFGPRQFKFAVQINEFMMKIKNYFKTQTTVLSESLFGRLTIIQRLFVDTQSRYDDN